MERRGQLVDGLGHARRHLPLWAMLYSLLIWWPIWPVTEEPTYNGYLASPFAALSHHRWVAYSLVGF